MRLKRPEERWWVLREARSPALQVGGSGRWIWRAEESGKKPELGAHWHLRTGEGAVAGSLAGEQREGDWGSQVSSALKSLTLPGSGGGSQPNTGTGCQCNLMPGWCERRPRLPTPAGLLSPVPLLACACRASSTGFQREGLFLACGAYLSKACSSTALSLHRAKQKFPLPPGPPLGCAALSRGWLLLDKEHTQALPPNKSSGPWIKEFKFQFEPGPRWALNGSLAFVYSSVKWG